MKRIGTMTIPASPKEMEEDGGEDEKVEGSSADQKTVADTEEASKNEEGVGHAVGAGEDENEQDNTDEEDLEETDKEEDVICTVGAPKVLAPP